MELLNKTHKEIQAASQVKRTFGKIFMKLEKEGITFSAAAVREFKLIKGRYIHFTYENYVVYFFQNESKVGFQLFNRSNGQLAFKSKPLSNIITKRLQVSKLPIKLRLEHTGERFADESALIKVIVDPKLLKSNHNGN